MEHVAWRVIVVFMMFNVLVFCAENATAPLTPHAPPKEVKHTGAVSSLIKMLVDIPMGVVEAFKDGADAIEGMVMACMRGAF